MFGVRPNCLACWIDSTASRPQFTLMMNSAPELAMLVRYWLKSCVPRGETWLVTIVHPAFPQEVVHRLGNRVAIGVVWRHERRLAVLAEVLDQDRADRIGRRLAVEALTERVARTILAGRV